MDDLRLSVVVRGVHVGVQMGLALMADMDTLKRHLADVVDAALRDWQRKCSPHSHVSVHRPMPNVLQVGSREPSSGGIEYIEITVRRKYT